MPQKDFCNTIYHVWTSSTSPPCSLPSSTESSTSARQPRGATAHGEAREVKLGGLSAPTQDVSGASGAARNEAITAWAQGDAGGAKSPTAGMLDDCCVGQARRGGL